MIQRFLALLFLLVATVGARRASGKSFGAPTDLTSPHHHLGWGVDIAVDMTPMSDPKEEKVKHVKRVVKKEAKGRMPGWFAEIKTHDGNFIEELMDGFE